MSTVPPRHTPAAPSTPALPARPDAHDDDHRTSEAPDRGLLDRISEAVRAAHAASVPF